MFELVAIYTHRLVVTKVDHEYVILQYLTFIRIEKSNIYDWKIGVYHPDMIRDDSKYVVQNV